MARPVQEGLKYYPKDVDFYSDKKIKLLRAEFGAEGVEVYERILCQCYYGKGYYLAWGDDDYLLMACEMGIDGDRVRDIINACLSRNLFARDIFDEFGILSSRRIQNTYFFAIRDTRVKASAKGQMTHVRNDICLMTDDDFSELNKSAEWVEKDAVLSYSENNPSYSTNNDSYSENNPDYSTINPAKKSKEKKSKEKNIIINKARTHAYAHAREADAEEKISFSPQILNMPEECQPDPEVIKRLTDMVNAEKTDCDDDEWEDKPIPWSPELFEVAEEYQPNLKEIRERIKKFNEDWRDRQ